MNDDKDKATKSIFQSLAPKGSGSATKDKPSLELTPAMPELGTAPCPVCGHLVTVFVTRTKRPFINCGFCSARIFYNGSRSMQLLRKQIKGSATRIVQTSEQGPEQTEESRTQPVVIDSSTKLQRRKG